MDKLINCNLCGKDNTTLLFIKNKYRVVQCKNCSLVYVNPQPDKRERAKLFGKSFFIGHSLKNRTYKNYFLEKSKNPMIFRRIKELNELKSKGNLLDIGCAHGFFLNEAKKIWEVEGVDISRYAVDYAKNKYKLKVYFGDLDTINFADNSFDIITIWGLVAHLDNPVKILTQVNRILKKGGILALNISNFGSFRAKINGINWRQLIPPDYLHFYSLSVLKKILKLTGFKVVKVTGKKEMSIRQVINNPDLNKITGKKYKFIFDKIGWIRLYLYGLLCWLSEKTDIGNLTVGSNIDIYAKKI